MNCDYLKFNCFKSHIDNDFFGNKNIYKDKISNKQIENLVTICYINDCIHCLEHMVEIFKPKKQILKVLNNLDITSNMFKMILNSKKLNISLNDILKNYEIIYRLCSNKQTENMLEYVIKKYNMKKHHVRYYCLTICVQNKNITDFNYLINNFDYEKGIFTKEHCYYYQKSNFKEINNIEHIDQNIQKNNYDNLIYKLYNSYPHIFLGSNMNVTECLIEKYNLSKYDVLRIPLMLNHLEYIEEKYKNQITKKDICKYFFNKYIINFIPSKSKLYKIIEKYNIKKEDVINKKQKQNCLMVCMTYETFIFIESIFHLNIRDLLLKNKYGNNGLNFILNNCTQNFDILNYLIKTYYLNLKDLFIGNSNCLELFINMIEAGRFNSKMLNKLNYRKKDLVKIINDTNILSLCYMYMDKLIFIDFIEKINFSNTDYIKYKKLININDPIINKNLNKICFRFITIFDKNPYDYKYIYKAMYKIF